MLGATLALAVVLGTPPSSDPVALVAQLGSPRYALRESAEVDLARLGRVALPALRAARDSRDPEIRTRASTLHARIEGSLLVQPTLVSFDFRDVPLAEAIKAINRQTGLALSVAPEDASELSGRRLTLGSGESLPFWKAIDALCVAGDLHHMADGQALSSQRDGSFPLHDGPGPPTGPTSDSGPFRVHLYSLFSQSELHLGRPRPNAIVRGNQPATPDDLSRSSPVPARQFFLQLVVVGEPRLSITPNGPVKVDSAVDDRGRSLLIPPGTRIFQHSAGYFGMNPSSMTRLRVDLAYPESGGKQIRSVKGSIPVIVAARKPEAMDIKLDGALGKSFRNDEVELTVRDSKPARNNQPATVELTIKPLAAAVPPLDAGEGEPLAYRPESPQQQVEILDAQGRILPWFPSGTFTNGEETRLTLSMAARDVAAVPATVRYHAILRTGADIPFEFVDVPMP